VKDIILMDLLETSSSHSIKQSSKKIRHQLGFLLILITRCYVILRKHLIKQ